MAKQLTLLETEPQNKVQHSNKRRAKTAKKKVNKNKKQTHLDKFIKLVNDQLDIDTHLDKLLSEENREIQNGKPTVKGLMKLYTAKFGQIYSMSTEVISTNYALVKIHITSDKDGIKYNFEGVGESSNDNTDKPYNSFPFSVAETRALARALRKALNIGTVADEEVNEDVKLKDTIDEQPQTNNTVPWMIQMIEKRCQEQNVNANIIAKERFGKELNELNEDEQSQLYQAIKSL